ncbi:Spon1, partial [Symbiodinium pilosum]
PCIDAVRKTQPCNEMKCPGSEDCVMGPWSAWDETSCGDKNQKFRDRSVLQPATGEGHCSYGVS